MKVVTSVVELKRELDKYRLNGKKIGFAPTMGALHSGHISLIEAAHKNRNVSVCSIFVNPSQFNNAEDLHKYPRTLKADQKLLKRAGLDILFAPPVDEIYPKGLNTKLLLDLRGLDKVMEGKFRPGHFEGMVQVVKRLLDIVQPDSIYMGQKDFQQFTIVQYMIESLNIPTDLVICPIIREEDGLAMSSRNVRLSQEFRKIAPVIFKTLKWAKSNRNKLSIAEIKTQAKVKLEAAGLMPEYVEIVNAETLKGVRKLNQQHKTVICVAAWAGEIRLIDNIYFS